jgi:hypothetical protein
VCLWPGGLVARGWQRRSGISGSASEPPTVAVPAGGAYDTDRGIYLSTVFAPSECCSLDPKSPPMGFRGDDPWRSLPPSPGFVNVYRRWGDHKRSRTGVRVINRLVCGGCVPIRGVLGVGRRRPPAIDAQGRVTYASIPSPVAARITGPDHWDASIAGCDADHGKPRRSRSKARGSEIEPCAFGLDRRDGP